MIATPMLALDHFVLATPDLAGTTAAVGAALGVTPSAGGVHVGMGTRNTLLALGDGRYLEIIGIDPEQPSPATPRPFGIDGLREARLITWATRTTDIDSTLAAAIAAGYDPGSARAMQRATPTGEVLSWRLTMTTVGSSPAGEPMVGIVPFVIGWGSTTHPSTTCAQGARLVSFAATSPTPSAVAAQLQALGVASLLTLVEGPVAGLRAIIEGPGGTYPL